MDSAKRGVLAKNTVVRVLEVCENAAGTNRLRIARHDTGEPAGWVSQTVGGEGTTALEPITLGPMVAQIQALQAELSQARVQYAALQAEDRQRDARIAAMQGELEGRGATAARSPPPQVRPPLATAA